MSHSQLISCIDLNKGFLILFDWYPKSNGPTNPTSKKNSNRPLKHSPFQLPVSEGNLSIFVFWGTWGLFPTDHLSSWITSRPGSCRYIQWCGDLGPVVPLSSGLPYPQDEGSNLKVKEPGGTKSSRDEGTYCRTIQGPTCTEW